MIDDENEIDDIQVYLDYAYRCGSLAFEMGLDMDSIPDSWSDERNLAGEMWREGYADERNKRSESIRLREFISPN